MDLHLYLEGCGNGLGKHSSFIGNRFRYLMKIDYRKGQVFGKCTAMSQDPENCPLFAMGLSTGKTLPAGPAGDVDLADHTFVFLTFSRCPG